MEKLPLGCSRSRERQGQQHQLGVTTPSLLPGHTSSRVPEEGNVGQDPDRADAPSHTQFPPLTLPSPKSSPSSSLNHQKRVLHMGCSCQMLTLGTCLFSKLFPGSYKALLDTRPREMRCLPGPTPAPKESLAASRLWGFTM